MFKNPIICFINQEISAERERSVCNCVCAITRQNYGPCQYGHPLWIAPQILLNRNARKPYKDEPVTHLIYWKYFHGKASFRKWFHGRRLTEKRCFLKRPNCNLLQKYIVNKYIKIINTFFSMVKLVILSFP